MVLLLEAVRGKREGRVREKVGGEGGTEERKKEGKRRRREGSSIYRFMYSSNWYVSLVQKQL